VDIPRGRAARAAWLALPSQRRAEAVARAEFGRPIPDPVVQRAAVGWARYLRARLTYRVFVAVGLPAAGVSLAVAAGGSQLAAAVCGFGAACACIALAFLGGGQRTDRRLLPSNLAALLDGEPRGPAGIVRVGRRPLSRPSVHAAVVAVVLVALAVFDLTTHRFRLGTVLSRGSITLLVVLFEAIVLRHRPRPPMVIGYEGLVFPSIGLTVPWHEIIACELADDDGSYGDRVDVVWRLRDVDAVLARMPEGRRHKGFAKKLREAGGAIVVGAGMMTVPPERVVLASRAFLPVPAVGGSVGGEVDGARRRRADGVGGLGQ
jgi:hypothetical protein